MLQEGGFEGGFGFNEDGGGGVNEQIKEAFEKANESAKKFKAQQSAVKDLRKEEQKKRDDDTKIANIIIGFLNDPSNSKYFILIARLVARNIPSEFILSFISLIHKKSEHIIAGIKTNKNNKALQIKTRNSFGNLPPAVKLTIDKWTSNVYKVGDKNFKKVYLSLINPDNTIEDSYFQLNTFILEDFLKKLELNCEYTEVRKFIELVFGTMLKRYKEKTHNQKKIQDKS